MAVKTKDEIMATIRTVLGENQSDEAITLLEDVSDTLDANTGAGDGTDWKAKYEENDKNWREKYTSRFYNTDSEDDDELGAHDEQDNAPTTFEELFKES